MYSAFLWLDKDVDADSILIPKYVSRKEGSTLADLTRVAESHGISAEPLGNLTSASVKSSRYPLVLSVRSDLSQKAFDHYIVTLPQKDADPLLYDPTENTMCSFDILDSGYWSGRGLVVSEHPVNVRWIFAWEYAPFLAGFALLLLFRFCSTYFIRQRKECSMHRWGSSMADAVVILGIAFLTTVIYNGANERNMLLSENETVDSIQKRHLESFLPHSNAADVERALHSNGLVVDARAKSSFDAGHISGAINLEPWSAQENIDKLMQSTDKEREITIYCQSAGCPYAGAVARRLWEKGYRNLAYYKGGWMDWERNMGGKQGEQ